MVDWVVLNRSTIAKKRTCKSHDYCIDVISGNYDQPAWPQRIWYTVVNMLAGTSFKVMAFILLYSCWL